MTGDLNFLMTSKYFAVGLFWDSFPINILSKLGKAIPLFVQEKTLILKVLRGVMPYLDEPFHCPQGCLLFCDKA